MKQNPFQKFLGPEDRLHIAVCEYLQFQYPKTAVHHSPNEGKRSEFEQFKIKAMGVKSGFPDLVILFRGKHLAIELKAGRNKATPAQMEWIVKLKEQGWMAEVCNGFDEAKAAIDAFFKTI